MRFVASGKVKDIYEYDESHLLFRFSDRVSAYDVRFDQHVPRKGEVLCAFAEYWFGQPMPVPNHFVRRVSDTEILVRRLEMLSVECVVRGYFYGSLEGRWRRGEVDLPDGTRPVTAARLPHPVFDSTTKSDEHDVPVTRDAAVGDGLVTARQFDELSSASVAIYGMMSGVAESAGFVMADLKLEFGVDGDGRIVLADSVGPDECRLWPRDLYAEGRTQEAYDKQILRDWLTEHGHARRFEEARARGQEPVPPAIPCEIVRRMTGRYCRMP